MLGRQPIWTLHAWTAFDLAVGQTYSIVTQREKSEADGVTVLLCFSQIVMLTDLNRICYCGTQESLFHQSLWRCAHYKQRVLCAAVTFLLFLSRPKDAMRALKKRLSGNKNYREVMLALTVSSYFFLELYCKTRNKVTEYMSKALVDKNDSEGHAHGVDAF